VKYLPPTTPRPRQLVAPLIVALVTLPDVCLLRPHLSTIFTPTKQCGKLFERSSRTEGSEAVKSFYKSTSAHDHHLVDSSSAAPPFRSESRLLHRWPKCGTFMRTALLWDHNTLSSLFYFLSSSRCPRFAILICAVSNQLRLLPSPSLLSPSFLNGLRPSHLHALTVSRYTTT
jgi:hypothetical protein